MKIPVLFLSAFLFSACASRQITTTSAQLKTKYLLSSAENFNGNVQLTLIDNNNYDLVISENGELDAASFVKGTYTWSKNHEKLSLSNEISRFGTNQLQLNSDGELVMKDQNDVQIQLKKVEMATELTEKYWKLVAINGVEVTSKDFNTYEPHLIFKALFQQVKGNDGCNVFNGKFIVEGNQIHFTNMISTLMACFNSKIPNQFKAALREKLTYQVEGEQLILSSSNTELKFKVVYL